MTATDEVLHRHGLTREEYQRILEMLGREPTITELGIFSVMWSEHCSYKSSRVHLKTLPTTGKRVLQGPGENAGAVDIGDRSEEHTSELQSLAYLVCRLLLEKKKKKQQRTLESY